MPGLGCSGPCRDGRRVSDHSVAGGGRGRAGAVACGAHLDARGDVINNADRLRVCKTRQRVRDEVKLHLPWWLCPCLLPVDGFAGRALQAAILRQGCYYEFPGVPPGPRPLPTSPQGPLPLHGSPPCGPPCCHWSTWPPGRAGGTCGRSGPGGPQARAAHSCSGARPHSQML